MKKFKVLSVSILSLFFVLVLSLTTIISEADFNAGGTSSPVSGVNLAGKAAPGCHGYGAFRFYLAPRSLVTDDNKTNMYGYSGANPTKFVSDLAKYASSAIYWDATGTNFLKGNSANSLRVYDDYKKNWYSIKDQFFTTAQMKTKFGSWFTPKNSLASESYSEYATMFNNLDNVVMTETSRNALYDMFDGYFHISSAFSKTDDWVLVVEPLVDWRIPASNLTWLSTWQQALAYNNSFNGSNAYFKGTAYNGGANPVKASWLNFKNEKYTTGIPYYIWSLSGFYQSALPGCANLNIGMTKATRLNSGYAIYGADHETELYANTVNDAVVYTGYPGTSDSSKLTNYVGATTFDAKESITPSINAYTNAWVTNLTTGVKGAKVGSIADVLGSSVTSNTAFDSYKLVSAETGTMLGKNRSSIASSKVTMAWSASAVKGSTFNVGSSYNLSATNAPKGYLTKSSKTESITTPSGSKNTQKANYLVGKSAKGSDKVEGTGSLWNPIAVVGLAREVYIQPKNAKSNLVYINCDYQTGVVSGKLSSTSESYSTESKTTFTMPKDAAYVLAVKNTSATSYSSANVTKLVKQLQERDSTYLLTSLKAFFGGDLQLQKACKEGNTISVGADGGGYTVYVLVMTGGQPVETGDDSVLVLNPWELNRMYGDVVASSTGETNHVVLGNSPWLDDTVASYKIYDKSSGQTVSSATLLYNKLNGSFAPYSDVKKGWTVPTKSFENVTYAYNLSRGNIGDKRMVSGVQGSSSEAANYYTSGLGFTFGTNPTGKSIGVIGALSLSWETKLNSGAPCNALLVNSLASSKYTLNIKETVNSYITKLKAKGTGVTTKVLDATDSSDSTFNLAYVQAQNDLTLKFYPEVGFLSDSCLSDTIVNTGSVTSEVVKVMGDQKREAITGSMYLCKLSSADGTDGDINTDTYADGTEFMALSKANDDLPVIYAGSGINLSANIDYKVESYGYALDLVNKDVDTGTSYTGIVNDNSDVYKLWGNSGTTESLYKKYTDWISATANSTYAAEVSLEVSGSGVNKTYNKFNTTFKQPANSVNPTSKSEGVYPLTIAKGVLQKDAKYTMLIASIAKDYGCSTTKAKSLFEDSSIYKGVLAAIESCTSSGNTSASGPANLGNASHWYDEEVNTLVVRRYHTEVYTVNAGSLGLDDKIDYGCVPTSSDGSLKGAIGKWYVTLSLDKLSDGIVVNKTMFNKIHVEGSDFIVPSATTSDM